MPARTRQMDPVAKVIAREFLVSKGFLPDEDALKAIAVCGDPAALEERHWSCAPYLKPSIEDRYRDLLPHALARETDLVALEARFRRCPLDELRPSIAKRYGEVLAGIEDTAILAERYQNCPPDLKLLIVKRYREVLPASLAEISDRADLTTRWEQCPRGLRKIFLGVLREMAR